MSNYQLVLLRKVTEEVVDPYRENVWNLKTPISLEDVDSAFKEGRFESRPYDWQGGGKAPKWQVGEYDHAARIAYLASAPIEHPIIVGVNDILGSYVVILDGCHRIGAAIFRKDLEIAVDFDGYVEGFENWLASEIE